MAKRKVIFEDEKYYHIFNRGVDKRNIFSSKGDLYYFFNRLVDLNIYETSQKVNNQRNYLRGEVTVPEDGNELVSLVAYCLLPNHFHLILKQKVENGISKFMQKLGTSYTMYFNEKYDRSGSLFQGKFKATGIRDDYGLEKVSIYVNLNYKHHNIDFTKSLVKTSLFEYLQSEKGESICDKIELEKIIKNSGGVDAYKKEAKFLSKNFAENKNNKLTDIDFSELE